MSRRTAKTGIRGTAAMAKRAPRARQVARRAVATGRSVAAGTATGSAAQRSSHAGRDVERYVAQVAKATPLEIVELERAGVPGALIKGLSKQLAIPTKRMFAVLGVPKATGESKASQGKRVTGSGGHAALGVVKLLAMAKEMMAHSTSSQAQRFDTATWLGQWIERPQPALGGRRPADLLDTPTGYEVVARLLGSIESGAFQ